MPKKQMISILSHFFSFKVWFSIIHIHQIFQFPIKYLDFSSCFSIFHHFLFQINLIYFHSIGRLCGRGPQHHYHHYNQNPSTSSSLSIIIIIIIIIVCHHLHQEMCWDDWHTYDWPKASAFNHILLLQSTITIMMVMIITITIITKKEQMKKKTFWLPNWVLVLCSSFFLTAHTWGDADILNFLLFSDLPRLNAL